MLHLPYTFIVNIIVFTGVSSPPRLSRVLIYTSTVKYLTESLRLLLSLRCLFYSLLPRRVVLAPSICP